MRKPRPQDFDPDYQETKLPEPEKIDMSGIVPIKEKQIFPDQETERKTERTELRTDDRSEKRTENRTEYRSYELPIKRNTKRYSFEFYEDQINSLKKIKYKIEMEGKQIAMSQIVRQAMDEYLVKQKLTPFGNPFERKTERTEERT